MELFLPVVTAATTAMQSATALAPYAAIAGTGLTAASTIAAGQQAKAVGEAQYRQGLMRQRLAQGVARQQEAQGLWEQAAAQREQEQLRRRKAMLLSEQQAKGAAGGFSASDTTAAQLREEAHKYGTLRERMSAASGQQKREDRFAQAEASRAEGRLERYGGAVSRAEGNAKSNLAYLTAVGDASSSLSKLALKYDPGARQASSTRSGHRYG